MQLLLSMGADVNALDGGYGSALQAALLHGYEQVALLLLDRGAKANTLREEHRAIKQAASENDHEKAKQLLLEECAHIKARIAQMGAQMWL